MYGPWGPGTGDAGKPPVQPPASWADRDVFVLALTGAGLREHPDRTAALLEELSAWRARPLPAGSRGDAAPTGGAGNLVSAVYEAAAAGAGVMVFLPESPWCDGFGREVIRRRLAPGRRAEAAAETESGTGAGDGPIALYVVDLTRSPVPVSLSDVPLDRLVAIMRRLLAPDGCPWDREQTHESLRPYLVEEAAEALEAIERHQAHTLTDELGDLLLQIAFHAALGETQGRFGPRDVSVAIERKMLYRHPHVFSDWIVADSGEVLRNWEALKGTGAAAVDDDPGTDTWRFLRKAAVRVAEAAFEVAFAAAQGHDERLAAAAKSFREQASKLAAAARCTFGGPSDPPEEEQLLEPS